MNDRRRPPLTRVKDNVSKSFDKLGEKDDFFFLIAKESGDIEMDYVCDYLPDLLSLIKKVEKFTSDLKQGALEMMGIK